MSDLIKTAEEFLEPYSRDHFFSHDVIEEEGVYVSVGDAAKVMREFASQSAPKWISIKERFPEKGTNQTVLVRFGDNKKIDCVKWIALGFFDLPLNLRAKLTHWAEIIIPEDL